MTALLEPLRPSLACIAFGSIGITYFGLQLIAPFARSVSLTPGETAAISLPLTVAWFSFSGTCILTRETDGLLGAVASFSRFAGQATFIAGIPVWAYWYLHLVFGVL